MRRPSHLNDHKRPTNYKPSNRAAQLVKHRDNIMTTTQNDTKTASIIAQLEAIAQRVFAERTKDIRNILPAKPLTLHHIMHHHYAEVQRGFYWLINDFIRDYDNGQIITIQGDGYRMTFNETDIFRILERYAQSTGYPTDRLARYAA